ncbi:MAG: sensor histidine kinase [Alistipes sp.]|nr:sensor histidine kinase [Alistipes sp.]
MEEKKWYRILWSYLREYSFTALLFVVFAAIFAMIFSLYDLETEAVLYAAALCFLVAAFLLAYRFACYFREHRQRRRILKNIEIEYDKLPEGRTLAEKDYLDMIRALGRINIGHLTEYKEKEQENIDYYTTWVHQIKTPISVMRMILQSEDTDEHRELAAELFRVEQYVEMVLCYLRLGSTATDYVFCECDLDGIIREAIHKYASSFVRKRIRLNYKPTDIKVLTDEKWLLFIIEQLLSNALKYTNSGAITIAVSRDKVLTIEDTGIGIAPEDLPRIFEKGFTGYNGRADKKSTGLGLYLCRETAKRLSVAITAESEPGIGTKFLVDLKMRELVVE